MTQDEVPSESVVDPARYHFDGREFLDGDWLTVFDGGLSQPIRVKFQIRLGRIRIVGIQIDNGEIVTAQTLREPRVAQIEDALNDYLRDEREDLALNRERAEHELDARLDPTAQEGARLHLEDVQRWERELDEALARVTARQEPGAPTYQSRGRGATPPTEADYLAFARLYLQQLAEKPRGAISATARAAGMDRSTVYRWIEACREPGREYLPPKDGA